MLCGALLACAPLAPAALILGTPAAAQTAPAPQDESTDHSSDEFFDFFSDPPSDRGADRNGAQEEPDLFEKGARSLLRGLMKEMRPAMQDLARSLSELEPMMREMARMVDDIGNYQKPQLMPNGDILIPRRPGAPPSPLLDHGLPLPHGEDDPPEHDLPGPGPDGQIEL